MNIIADMNTHTIASNNAYSTLLENIQYAKRRRLQAIGLTEHGPFMKGAPDIVHFKNVLQAIPEAIESIVLIKGIECNIMGTINAKIDIEDSLLNDLDWVSISYNPIITATPPSQDAMTATYIDLLRNPYLMVLAHPARYNNGFDYDKVVAAWRDSGKLIEIDEASLRMDENTIARTVETAIACKRLNARIIVNSDAHFAPLVGKFDLVLRVLNEIGFPEHLVVNADSDRFFTYVNDFNNKKRSIPVDRKGRPLHR